MSDIRYEKVTFGELKAGDVFWMVKPRNGVGMDMVYIRTDRDPDDYTQGKAETVVYRLLLPPDPETVKVLEELYAALLTDSRGKTVTGDDVEYHLNGSDMYIAVNKVRGLLSRLKGVSNGQ